MHLVNDFYAKDAVFCDPIGTHHGVDAIKRYYAGLYENVSSIKFEFTSIIGAGDEFAAVWVMHLSAKKLNGGKPISVPGVSHIRFVHNCDKVEYHRDYFDMGCFIYEHVPVLASVVKYIKRKLS